MLVQSWICKNFWSSIENNRTGETLELGSRETSSSRIVLRVGNGDNIDIDDSIDRDPTNEGIFETLLAHSSSLRQGGTSLRDFRTIRYSSCSLGRAPINFQSIRDKMRLSFPRVHKPCAKRSPGEMQPSRCACVIKWLFRKMTRRKSKVIFDRLFSNWSFW